MTGQRILAGSSRTGSNRRGSSAEPALNLARPGANFDFACEVTLEAARDYTRNLGNVPLYAIRFRSDPDRRPREIGFLAADVREDDSVKVYTTLADIPLGKHLGAIEALGDAWAMNRAAPGTAR